MDRRRLERIEEYVFSLFRERGAVRLLSREVFDSTDLYANADLVRAFEDLEKKWRLLVRFTKEGDDWVALTREGAAHAGVPWAETDEQADALPHPPKSST